MHSFEIKTKIKFGEGSLKALQEIQNKKILIITDPFMVESKAIDKILVNLKEGSYEVFSDIVPDPPIETVVSGIEVFKEVNPDVLIALGGGSAIDASKAIMDFSKKILKTNDIEFIAIPTTSGTGSEVTSFSVITDKQKGTKYPLVSDDLLPNVAILDPELVKTVPNFITADTGMDVLTHAIEAYVSTEANDFSDALAEKAIKLVFKYLSRAYKDGNDIEAREKMHNASCLAGMAFNQTSLGINHSIAHVLGGKFHVPHGRTNSILLPHVIEYNADIVGYTNTKYSMAANKYAQISMLLGLNTSNVRMGVKNLVNEIKKLQREMNMVTNLSQCKVNIYDLSSVENEIAILAINDGCTKTNPRVPTEKDIIDILNKIK
ncbi:1-propanol dehydrogenase PduQ [Romboutsia lituseburensis]|uniref:Alcohol dehydrogenase, class IV n=1 Tax=Romboutsia lituseburensis DSM 797 TaxID=1121325 RepID=A0A1G9I4N5_9FIRM|nr:1-propanol dehydrogenase PduQ [Romboutsia lituseburensis]CEH34059.1 Aldehyde-alcohol dehydrogenase 2 [Romboutsia lituseburensis]SDL19763.1 Alcohol dehydrogenase, class IV [Romboutsia lituseburensis DSM 797]